MDNLPQYLPIIFVGSWIFSVACFLYAVFKKSTKIGVWSLVTLVLISILQFVFVNAGVYQDFDRVPPGNIFLLVPTLLATVLALKSRQVFINLSLFVLTLVHVVRIPIEIGLWRLHHEGFIPKLMSFEAWNIDILAGISALFMLFYAFKQGKLIEARKTHLLIWNFVGLALILNIIVRAVLSFPFPLTQRLAFDMPNVAMLHFPYIWLATIIAPIVLFSHIVAIWQLLIASRK